MGKWSAAVNVAGIKPSNPTVFEEVPKGVYEAVIQESERHDKDNVTKFQFITELEGRYAGRQMHVWINDIAKNFNKGFMRNVLLSKGVPVATLDSQTLNISDETFKGVKCYVLVEPRESQPGETRKPYPNTAFVAPEDVEKVRNMIAGGTPPTTAASTAQAHSAAATPSNGAAAAQASMGAAANVMGGAVNI